MIGVFFLSRAAGRHLTRPLSELTQAAGKIADHGIGELPASQHGHDEVALLTRGFADMLARLKQAQDTLKRKIEERTEQLYETRHRLDRVLESARLIIWSTGARSGQLQFTSSAAKSLLGIEISELGRSLEQLMRFVHPEDRGRMLRAWADLAAGRANNATVDLRVVRADGEIRWVRNRLISAPGADGRAERIDSFANDITSNIQAEQHLHLREMALQATVNGVFISDVTQPDYPLVYVNPAFERITGYPAEEALGRNARFLLACSAPICARPASTRCAPPSPRATPAKW